MENKKEIYTPMEKLLIETLARRQEREDKLKLKKQTTAALELDLMLLEMEKQFDLMDGIKGEEWLV